MSVIRPKINNSDFETIYNAKLLSYTVGACEYMHGYLEPPASMIPVKLKYALGLRPITLKIDFEGATMEAATEKIRLFVKELHEGAAELLLPNNCQYTCYYKDMSAPVEKAPWILQTQIKLVGYRHGAQRSNTLTASATVNASGDYATPVIIRVTTTATDIIQITVGDTTVGVTATQNGGDVVIDGYKKTVKQGTANKFGDTVMTEFPKYEPGANEVAITGLGTGDTVTISYYPIYR